MELLRAFSFIPENPPRVRDVLTEAAEGYRFNGNKCDYWQYNWNMEIIDTDMSFLKL